MTRFKSISFVFFLLIAVGAHGQYNDFGTWTALTLSKDMPKGFDAKLKLQSRFNENLLERASSMADMSLRYKLNDHFRLAATYRIAQSRNLDESFDPRHRIALDLLTSVELGKVDLKWRCRYQLGDNNILADEGADNRREAYRNKFSIERKVMKKTQGWMSYEFFSGYENGSLQWTDWRWKAGLERKIKKRHYVGVGFMVQSERIGSNPLSDYVVLLSYDIDLKKFKKKKKEEAAN